METPTGPATEPATISTLPLRVLRQILNRLTQHPHPSGTQCPLSIKHCRVQRARGWEEGRTPVLNGRCQIRFCLDIAVITLPHKAIDHSVTFPASPYLANAMRNLCDASRLSFTSCLRMK